MGVFFSPTNFQFSVPLTTNRCEGKRARREWTAAVAGRARILVVEDEAIIAMDLIATLKRLAGGHRNGGHRRGFHRPGGLRTSDIVLMDIRLRGTMDVWRRPMRSSPLGIPSSF